MVYIPKCVSSQFYSWWARNAVAREGSNWNPIATPSICLYKILICDSFVAKDPLVFLSNFEQCHCFLKVH